MRLVLSNEYVYGLGPSRLSPCDQLIKALIASDAHDVRFLRTIVQEVCRNLPERYQDMGFKEGDAHIGAYAEVVEADILVSENRRHFHAMAGHLPFKVMDAAQFLKRHAAA